MRVRGCVWSVNVFIIGLLVVSSLSVLFLLHQYAANGHFETKIVYPEKPLLISLNPNYLEDELGVTPKDFPYKRVDLDVAIETYLANSLSLYQLQGHIATYEVDERQCLTLFKESQEEAVVVVSWILDDAGSVKIAQVVSEKLRYLGHIDHEPKQTGGSDALNAFYRETGGTEYYELNVRITSPSLVLGTLYYLYDWTKQEGYYSGTLVYSVTAAGYFWVNYGVEVWVGSDVSYSTIHNPLWTQDWFTHSIIGNHGPSASIRADGQSHMLFVYMQLWASVSVNYYLESQHNGGGTSWVRW